MIVIILIQLSYVIDRSNNSLFRNLALGHICRLSVYPGGEGGGYLLCKRTPLLATNFSYEGYIRKGKVHQKRKKKKLKNVSFALTPTYVQ